MRPLSSLKLEVRDRVAYLRFEHGKANEMGREQLHDLETLCALLESGEVIALLSYSERLSSKGQPIFISGANVTERSTWSESDIKTHVRYQRAVLARLRHAPVFHLAIVNGIAFGWGTEYLITCDYRIACQDARFALPETGLGILPGAGGSSELWSMIGISQALRLGMTGQQNDAAEAHRIGLVQEVVPDVAAGLARAESMLALVRRRSPSAMAAFKAAALAAVGRDPAERQGIEAAAYEHCVDSGEAAIGRANFDAIVKGQSVQWGPTQRYMP
jgi:enoyl-CoA hydratase/carnithine racemase